MLNLEEILLGEGVLGNHGSRQKGIQRSESAKLTTEGKLEVGIKFSDISSSNAFITCTTLFGFYDAKILANNINQVANLFGHL